MNDPNLAQQGYNQAHYPGAAPMQPAVGVWQCPFCRSTGTLGWREKISTGGWLVILFTCGLLTPIGLFFMKDRSNYCTRCGSTVGAA